jgi:chromosomal replication initiation ATPase DnaA
MLPDRRQMTLAFSAEEDAEPAFQLSRSNARAAAWMTADWPDRRLAVWGPPASGKSHLLRDWARRLGATVLSGLTLEDDVALPLTGAMAIDDADLVAPEHLLLRVLNVAQERRLLVALTSRAPPARWLTQSPDLRSRLRAIATVEIGLPDAALRARVFAALIESKQILIASGDIGRIAERLPVSIQSVRKLVMVLERLCRDSYGPLSRSVVERVAAAIRREDEEVGEDVLAEVAG